MKPHYIILAIGYIAAIVALVNAWSKEPAIQIPEPADDLTIEDFYQPVKPEYKGPSKLWGLALNALIFILSVLMLLVAFTSIANAQSHCERSKVFIAEMNTTISLERTGAPVMSVGAGVSGVYGKGTLLDNFSVLGGFKSVIGKEPGKPSNDRLTLLPTATVMYKIRLNGPDSRTVHAFAWVTGRNYTGVDYRAYMAPTERSFAVIGGIVSWNNLTGWNVGISVLGMF